MQKKIIALAIASALTMPAMAMAAPTVYGQVNMAYEMTDTGAAAAGTGTTAAKRNQVSSNVSRIGVKGSEDLGNGLTGVYQMEGQVAMDTGATTLFDRDTYLGVAGGFGAVLLGSLDTPYKSSTRGMDVFADSSADNRSIMGNFFGLTTVDAAATDVLAYATPDFSGFSAVVAMVGENDNTLANPLGASAVSATTLSAKYGKDNWSAALGYISLNGTDANPANEFTATGTKLGGTYTMDAFAVNAVYEMLSAKTGAAGTKSEQNNLYIGGSYNVSAAGKVKLGYTMGGESKTGGNTNAGSGATQVSLGYDHAMTKNTTVFAAYTSIANDTAATYGLTSTGSTADMAGAAGADNDPNAISIGLRHSF